MPRLSFKSVNTVIGTLISVILLIGVSIFVVYVGVHHTILSITHLLVA